MRGSLDLRDIEMVVRVAELGGMTRAAAVLNIVQPALSRHVQRVETALGAALFDRLPRGVRLTRAGEQFIDHARRMLKEFDRVREAVAVGQVAVQGRVTLGLSPSVAPVVLPELVSSLRAHAPAVTLSVQEGFSPALRDALLQGRIDVAILTNPAPSRALYLVPLLAEPIVLLSRAERGARGISSVAELPRTPVLVSAGIRAVVDDQLRPRGVALRVELQIDSLEAIRRMALRGEGIAVVPVSTFRDDVESGRLRANEIAGVNLHRLLVMAHRVEPGRDAPTRLTGSVADHLRQAFATLANAGTFTVPAPAATSRRRSSHAR